MKNASMQYVYCIYTFFLGLRAIIISKSLRKMEDINRKFANFARQKLSKMLIRIRLDLKSDIKTGARLHLLIFSFKYLRHKGTVSTVYKNNF